MIGNVDWSSLPLPDPAGLERSARLLLEAGQFPVEGGIGQKLLGKAFRGACRLRPDLSLDVEVTHPDPGGDEWIVLMRALPQRCVDSGRFVWKVQVGIYPDGDQDRAVTGLRRAWQFAGRKTRDELLAELKRLATLAALVCTLQAARGVEPVVQTVTDPRFVEVDAACPPEVIRALLQKTATPETPG